MPYRYEIEDHDYTHFSSGRVFYGIPGIPALPIRLTCEVFQRCKALLNLTRRITLYDPCCGAAYHLIALAYLCWEDIQTIYASDVDGQALEGARRNLSLVSSTGLEQRIQEIRAMLGIYGKPAHTEALESALWLKERLITNLQKHPIQVNVFQSDATLIQTPPPTFQSNPPDIILADIPYGRHATWKTTQNIPPANPIGSMLDGLIKYATPNTILAIVANKTQNVTHPSYQRIQNLNFGKRQVVILKKYTTEKPHDPV